jgi:hypothetical protein
VPELFPKKYIPLMAVSVVQLVVDLADNVVDVDDVIKSVGDCNCLIEGEARANIRLVSW